MAVSDPNKWWSVGTGIVFAITLPIILGVVIACQPTRTVNPGMLQVTPPEPELPPGEAVYKLSCTTCHGPNADGVPGLGKPLRNSAFVQKSSDDDLFLVISEGRFPDHPDNTTGAMMPARGAQGLDDGKLRDVIGYLRELQDPSQPVASVEPWLLVEPGAPASAAADIAGYDIFIASCSACHGANAEGMENLGKPLAGSEFFATKTDKEITTFIKMGRAIWDPENTTGIDMPAKGGNPALSDDDIAIIIAFVRALSESSGSTQEKLVGQDLYVASCSACHGANGEGMDGLGKPLAGSEFAASKSDKDLATFIKMGRPIWDAENTTGIDMPPKGGNPALSDDELNEIILYIRAVSQ